MVGGSEWSETRTRVNRRRRYTGQPHTLLPILTPMRKPKIEQARQSGDDARSRSHVPGATDAEAGLIGDGRRTARKPAEKPHREFAAPVPMGSPGWRSGLASNFFLGEISQMGGSRFHSAGPRDVCDGRWSDGRRARGWSRLTLRSRTAVPETLRNGRWLLAVEVVGAMRARCPRWARLEAR
jgi:hypothetical protein